MEALQLEKKKRQHSKRLGLTGKEVTGTQWFGVPEILEAKALQAQKEVNIESQKHAKEVEKEARLHEKEALNTARKERAVQVAVERQMLKETRATVKQEEKAAKLVVKEAQKAVTGSKKAAMIRSKGLKGTTIAVELKSSGSS